MAVKGWPGGTQSDGFEELLVFFFQFSVFLTRVL